MFTVKILSKWAGIGLGSVLLFVAVAYGAMRMNDGPVEFYPWFTISIGGPFRSGELTAAPQSWEFSLSQLSKPSLLTRPLRA